MTLDYELALACQNTYKRPASFRDAKTGVYVCLSRATGGILIAAFRGSITPQDWFRDLNTMAVPTKTDPEIGFCHAGFLDASVSITPAIAQTVKGARFYLTGHSLGGAEAVGVATLLLKLGLVAEKVVTFGAPKFGGWHFRQASKPLQITQYRYGADPVPTQPPIYVPPLGVFLYTRKQVILPGSCPVDPLSCHHIENYVDALA